MFHVIGVCLYLIGMWFGKVLVPLLILYAVHIHNTFHTYVVGVEFSIMLLFLFSQCRNAFALLVLVSPRRVTSLPSV